MQSLVIVNYVIDVDDAAAGVPVLVVPRRLGAARSYLPACQVSQNPKLHAACHDDISAGRCRVRSVG